MMADESDDVSDAGSQKQIYSEVNDENKNYACCSKRCSVVLCTFCDKIMHKNCAKKMENVKFIDGFHVNCCQSYENVLKKPETRAVIATDFVDRRLLETKIRFLVQLLESSNEKNEILKQNNSLLLQRICDLEEKQITNKGKNIINQYAPPIDKHPQYNQSNHMKEISTIKIINGADKPAYSVTDDPNARMISNNTSSTLSANNDLKRTNEKSQLLKLHKVEQPVNTESKIRGNAQELATTATQQGEFQWNTVVKKKQRVPKISTICTGSKQVTSESKIKGAPRKKWLYVGRVYGSDVSEADIMDFLQESMGTIGCEVKKLPTKGNNSAFSVGVPSEDQFTELSKPESWPKGVILREFNFRNFFRKETLPITIT